jgi:very-short-patch-repair endonuclease
MRENHGVRDESPERTADTPHRRLSARREQRASPSRIESILWLCLRDRRFHGLKFRRQHSIGRFIADFYCEAEKLVVEADGPVHDDPVQQQHDAERDAWMARNGYLVVRLPQDEIITATELALERVERALRSAGRSF